QDVTEALSRIAEREVPFVSRGDDSGTHKAELRLWEASGLGAQDPRSGWYRETGSGMGATLNIAIGMKAYTLTDRGTWLAFGNKEINDVLVEGDTRLFNQYGIIAVNPSRHPSVKAEDGQAFVDWILSPQGQAAIAAYRIDGKQLFVPNAN
ncbi:MAG: substrate-binding domain-containing protein, partial [Pseudomonadota bacterium]